MSGRNVVKTVEPLGELSADEMKILRKLNRRLNKLKPTHIELEKYYEGRQHIASIGIAIPEVLRKFIFALNWPRITVDSVVRRQAVKSFSVPDDPEASKELRRLWEANNLDSQQILVHTEARVQGHSFVSIGVNPKDPSTPIITAEPAKSMICLIDPVTRLTQAALRVYRDEWSISNNVQAATLYLPDSTIHVRKINGQFKVVDRDNHNLGYVPVVQFTNKPKVGDFVGESEMADVLRPTDMAARATLDLQIAMEVAAVPGKYVVGATDNEFIDATTGQPATAFNQYFSSILKVKNTNAKFGQFTAADLGNFTKVITAMSEQVSAVTGLPVRYFGQNTANPVAEGAIRADEIRLVKNVEAKNIFDGDCWSQVMGIAYKIAYGTELPVNRVRCDWNDPNTPTYAQKADAVQKMAAAGLLSVEGAWDELGWSEARKDTERAYMEAENQQIANVYAKQIGEDDDATTTARTSASGSESGSHTTQNE